MAMDFMYSKVWDYLDDGDLIIPVNRKGTVVEKDAEKTLSCLIYLPG
jgi:hypothetical protein